MAMCKWSITRAILTKTVEPDELGKALGGLAIVAAVAIPFINAPAFRELYKASLDVFPGAVAVLAGAMMLIAFNLNAVFYINRKKMMKNESEENQRRALLK